MGLGRDHLPVTYFENPFRGVPKPTEIMDVSYGGTVLLGPVPVGHVYRVVDIDFHNLDSGTVFPRLYFLVGGLSGTAHLMEFAFYATGVGFRMPIDKSTAAGNLRSWVITLEADDVLKVDIFFAAAATEPQVQASYWDIRQ